MAYKKFVKRGGKIFGPYYYESYRDKSGRVKKKYVGTIDPAVKVGRKKFEVRSGVKKSLLVFGVVLVLLVLIGGLVFLDFDISGRALLDVGVSYFEGENISGILGVGLKNGEMLPIDSRVIVGLGDFRVEYLLSDFLEGNVEGDFYIEGQEIFGSGAGYGFEGEKKVYPKIYFTLVLEDYYGGGCEEDEYCEEEYGEVKAKKSHGGGWCWFW